MHAVLFVVSFLGVLWLNRMDCSLHVDVTKTWVACRIQTEKFCGFVFDSFVV